MNGTGQDVSSGWSRRRHGCELVLGSEGKFAKPKGSRMVNSVFATRLCMEGMGSQRHGWWHGGSKRGLRGSGCNPLTSDSNPTHGQRRRCHVLVKLRSRVMIGSWSSHGQRRRCHVLVKLRSRDRHGQRRRPIQRRMAKKAIPPSSVLNHEATSDDITAWGFQWCYADKLHSITECQ